MSDSDTLDAMRTKLRELELDHVQLAGRIMELNECIALVEHGPRRKSGRPRRIEAVATEQLNTRPDGVPGGIAETPTHLFPEDAA